MKAMHRLIMLSNTYQKSNLHDSQNASVDAENRYLWRMNRRRIEAEILRDALLLSIWQAESQDGRPPGYSAS